jgi:hypothetical protein
VKIPRHVQRWIEITKPLSAEASDALAKRWRELPDHVRTPAQIVGRRSLGCEGTHGVFPQCDFACKPCYHSTDANKVRIDGPHTLREIASQMLFLRSARGPASHAQLIGGEVSLLAAADHAEAISIMRANGRMPMSFTHGDIDDSYLDAVVLVTDGKPRFKNLAFAGHFDTTMRGRRGAEKPASEAELDPFRERFAAMFTRLRKEHGIRSYLAHNMTVTPDNLAEVAGVVARCRFMGYRMFSFQPAAYVGNESRWSEGFRAMTPDDVWAEIERGVGSRLPFGAIQFGDVRCNRTSWGAWVGDRFVPIFDDDDPADLATRDLFYEAFPGNQIGEERFWLLLVRALRSVIATPRCVPVGLRWARRFVRRAGGLGRFRGGVRAMTFVMHNFMDERVVSAAWSALGRGVASEDPAVIEAIERLQACVYTMGHPATGQLVPACVQHSLLDPAENRQLVKLLPRSPKRANATEQADV